MTARDVDLLQHRIDTITRAATRIRAHVADLHVLAYERTVVEHEHVRGGAPDRTPRGGDPRALRLWERLIVELGRAEDTLVGLERQVIGHFLVNSTSADPSRGSLIPAADHARQLAKQRARQAAGEYTPTRLVPQPDHPGKGRSS